jgi:hypothetical protein
MLRLTIVAFGMSGSLTISLLQRFDGKRHFHTKKFVFNFFKKISCWQPVFITKGETPKHSKSWEDYVQASD